MCTTNNITHNETLRSSQYYFNRTDSELCYRFAGAGSAGGVSRFVTRALRLRGRAWRAFWTAYQIRGTGQAQGHSVRGKHTS